MIVVVELLWSLKSLLAHYYQVLLTKGKAIPMAIQCSESISTPPPIPWKRTAEFASLGPKRLKETTGSTKEVMDALSMEEKNMGGREVRERSRKERKRPARIEIPEASMSMGFGEVGKKEGLVEEGFEVEGNEYWLASRKGTRHAMEDGYGVMTSINGDSKQVRM